jgi:hypothetical protein
MAKQRRESGEDKREFEELQSETGGSSPTAQEIL